MAIACPGFAQISAGDEFTRFYRRLVEGIDPKKGAGEDGLQHEMHHQGAERPLVEALDVDGADRAPCRGQGLGNGALLGRHQVAGAVTGEVIGVGYPCQIRRDARARSRRTPHGSR